MIAFMIVIAKQTEHMMNQISLEMAQERNFSPIIMAATLAPSLISLLRYTLFIWFSRWVLFIRYILLVVLLIIKIYHLLILSNCNYIMRNCFQGIFVVFAVCWISYASEQPSVLLNEEYTLVKNQTLMLITQHIKVEVGSVLNIRFSIFPTGKAPNSNLSYTICIAEMINTESQGSGEFLELIQNLTVGDFYEHSFQDFKKIDLQAASNGNQQNIILKVTDPDFNAVLLGIRNFDNPSLKRDISFKTTIWQSQENLCPPCQSGMYSDSSDTISGSCFCLPCQENHYGKDCQMEFVTLEKYTPYTMVISQFERKTILIPLGDLYDKSEDEKEVTNKSIIIIIRVRDSDCLAYFSNSTVPVPTVSYFNSSGQIPLGIIDSSSAELLLFGNSSEFFSISFEKYTEGAAEIEVIYDQVNFRVSLNLTLICLVLLFCCLVVMSMSIAKFKRFQFLQRRMHGNANFDLQAMKLTNQLSEDQIIRYFPPITYQQLLSEKDSEFMAKGREDQSIQHSSVLSEKQIESERGTFDEADISDQLEKQHLECSICIARLEKDNLLIITYCGHIFHMQCIDRWFQKQTTCPYCRSEFTKSNIKALYNEVAWGKIDVEGVELARLLFERSNRRKLGF